MQNSFWTGYSNGERQASIHAIKEVVANYGDVVDFKFFSDISITIEIKEFKVASLFDELGKTIALDPVEHLDSTSLKVRTLYLNITFIKVTGDLKIEVPAGPDE